MEINRKFFTKNIGKKLLDVLFIGVILLMLFNPGAKAWVLTQLMHAGLFKAEIKEEKPGSNTLTSMPTFSFYDATGNIISSGQLKGKVVFINFWATWCPPCRAEMPSLHALYQKFKDNDNIEFLFISEDKDINKAIAYLKNEKYDMPLTRRSGAVPESMYSGTLPTTVILDKTGKIIFKKEGFANYNSDDFVKQINEIL